METTSFPCEQCDKIFKSKKSLNRHVRAEHMGISYSCATCDKVFKYLSHKVQHERTCTRVPDLRLGSMFPCSRCRKTFNLKHNRNRHEKTCSGPAERFDCSMCGKRCATAHGLRWHEQSHVRTPPKRKETPVNEPIPAKQRKTTESFHCRRCTDTFDTRRDLYRHGMARHFQTGAGLQRVPWNDGQAPWDDAQVDLRQEYETNARLILQQDQPGPMISTYNVPVNNDVTIRDLMRMARNIYNQQQHAFKLNLVFGVILRHRETGEYRFFRPFSNNSVLDSPIYIGKRQDFRRLYLRLRKLDVLTELLRQRPDTKWIPVLLTNVRFTIFHTHYPIGNAVQVPEYISKSLAIHALIRNMKTAKAYDDEVSMWIVSKWRQGRCLSSGPNERTFAAFSIRTSRNSKRRLTST